MYTVKQAAEIAGVTADTVRYYDKRGLLLGIGRDGAGAREFDARAVEWLRAVVALRESGMSVSEIELLAASVRKGSETAVTRVDVLAERRQALSRKIEALSGCIDVIDALLDAFKAELAQKGVSPLG